MLLSTHDEAHQEVHGNVPPTNGVVSCVAHTEMPPQCA